MKKYFFILTFLSSCTLFNRQSDTSDSLLNSGRHVSGASDSEEVDRLWLRVNDRKDSLIRSNPTHYWAWMKKFTPSELKDIAKFDGQITADPHYFNFADIHKGDGGGLALVDVDDSGKASYYLDFVRYSIFVKAYLKKDYTAELFQAYLDGLQLSNQKAPDVLKKPINKSRQELEDENAKWVKKNLKDGNKLDNKLLEITGFKDLAEKNPAKVKLGKELRDSLISFKKAKQIYDVGYLENDSGSSRGMGRYWFSLLDADDNKVKIVECKQLSEPATSYYQKQKQHKERIADVLEYFSDFKTNDSYVFSLPNESFWCRPKHFQFLKREDVEKDLKPHELVEYSQYLAYWIGFKQASQPKSTDYVKAMQKDQTEILKATKDLITTYEDHVFQLK